MHMVSESFKIHISGNYKVIFVISVAQLCPALCDTTDCSTLGFPVHHQPLELAQTHVHQVSDLYLNRLCLSVYMLKLFLST